MQLAVSEKLKRPPLWSKEQFLKDLRDNGGGVRAACRTNADESTSDLALYNDVWKWRKLDKEFDTEVKSLMAYPPVHPDGRPPKDGGDTSWYQDYCDELRVCNGNWSRASKKTPYSARQIFEFLDPNSTSFRKDFHDLVAEVFIEVAGDLQEMFFSIRSPENFESFEAVKIAQQKAWIALKGLEKLDSQRWGRRSEVNISGKVSHVHKQEDQAQRDQMLLQLWDERAQFFEKKRQILLDAPQVEVELPTIIEAELVETNATDPSREV